SERSHQIVEAALLVAPGAVFHQFYCARQKLAHAGLVFQVFDHWRIFARQLLKAFFASRIRQSTCIKDKATTVSSLVFWRPALMEGKTEDSQDQIACCCIREFRGNSF